MVYLYSIYKEMSDNYNKKLANNIKSKLTEIGESPKREGLIKTPERVAMVIKAKHLCMQIRGVQKQHSTTTNSAFSVIFLKDDKTRAEFMNLIQ